MNKDKVRILPWHIASKSVKGLKQALGIKGIKLEGSKFTGGSSYTVINYGATNLPDNVKSCSFINHPSVVATVVDKLQFFNKMSKSNNPPRLPEYTSDTDTALRWANEGKQVVARTVLNGHSGSGIVFFSDVSEFVKAKLYTQYIQKKEEYRVHVFGGSIIDVQRKVLRKTDDNGKPIDPKTIDFRVRSHSNGFIFQRNGIKPPDDVLNQAMKAYHASGLDFGAFDVIWNESRKSAYVLEVNTAPGLEGETLEIYANAFQGVL